MSDGSESAIPKFFEIDEHTTFKDGGQTYWQRQKVLHPGGGGVTVRDFFAAHAPDMPFWFVQPTEILTENMAIRTRWCYVWADAMLKERAK